VISLNSLKGGRQLTHASGKLLVGTWQR